MILNDFSLPFQNSSEGKKGILSPFLWGCPGVPVHGGIPIVFTSIHGVVTQFVNVSFLCVPVHEDTTLFIQSAKEMSFFWSILSIAMIPLLS